MAQKSWVNVKLTEEEIKEVVKFHRKWCFDEPDGVFADLSGADLRSANLSGADLSGADLRSADLSGANLSGADLSGANLSDADLRSADLSGANLSGADLSGADLRSADLRSANLSGADLRSANLSGADLSGANLRSANWSGATGVLHQVCPEEGEFIAWKMVRFDCNKIYAKLLIPKNAKRLTAYGSRKCRASSAKVLGFYTKEKKPIRKDIEAYSDHNNEFKYKKGQTLKPDSFDPDPRNQCSNGIHFFITFADALDY